MNQYIGHALQISGVEEYRLIGGKGDGMRLYHVSNGLGLEMDISPDRNGDITRLRFQGINMSYMSPCGYVAPAYYESTDKNWLKSFTAGFLTTCGLQAVGNPCVDEGEVLSLHGSIANQPCEHSYWTEDEKMIRVCTTTKDQSLCGKKYVLNRVIEISKTENQFTIRDEVVNEDDCTQPVEILYHMNMGYPLLDEDSIVRIPSVAVTPRNDHAAEDIANWMHMQKPEAGYEERCYYHKFSGEIGEASIFQPKLRAGLKIEFDTDTLDTFVEWKKMRPREYVLGLECGNCYPDGRDVMRKTGMLKFLKAGERVRYRVTVTMLKKEED